MSSNGALRTVEELVPSGNFIGTSTADVRIPLIVRSGNRIVLVPGMLDTLSRHSLTGESIAPVICIAPTPGEHPLDKRFVSRQKRPQDARRVCLTNVYFGQPQKRPCNDFGVGFRAIDFRGLVSN